MNKQHRALFICGGWAGHSPVETADLFMPILEERGFDVTLEHSLETYADVDFLKTFSVIVQSWTMGDILAEELRGLTQAVISGTGFAGWHGGIVDSFRIATDYLNMTGGQFVAHPHGIREYQVTPVPSQADHPIMRGIEPFTVVSEQYWTLTDSLNTVLATTTIPKLPGDPWAAPIEVPVAWVRTWGAGRLFVNTIGHGTGDLSVEPVQEMMLRGIEWAAHS